MALIITPIVNEGNSPESVTITFDEYGEYHIGEDDTAEVTINHVSGPTPDIKNGTRCR